MSENEVVSNDQVTETDVNGIKISNEVVSIIAGIAASEVAGVAGMSGGIVGGISEILGKKNFSKGIKVDVADDKTSIEIYIIVEYGVRIPDVAWEIQHKVKDAVEEMTGLTVTKVNIHVQGVKVEKELLEIPENSNEEEV